MAPSGRALSLLAAVAAILVAGCAPRRPLGMRPATAEGLLATLTARRGAVNSLRARAHLRSRLAAAATRQALLVRRPGAVRIDVLHPFGLALAVGMQDARLWAYRPSDATRYEGAATPANLSRILGAPLAVADIVDVLLGVPPARTSTGTPALEATPAGEYRLTLPLVDGVQTIRFAGDTLVVLGAEETRGGETLLRVSFDDYRDGFPHAIEVSSPAANAAAKLTLDAVEPNAVIDPSLFAPPPAPHVLPLEAALEAP